MINETALREHLLYLLGEGGAHVGFEEAIADFPLELRGARPSGVPHTLAKECDLRKIPVQLPRSVAGR